MVNKLNLFLTALLLVGMSFSCKDNDREDAVTPVVDPVEPARAVLFEETFEGPMPFSQAQNTAFGAAHSLVIVTDPVYQGTHSARFQLRDTDPMISDGTRAEVTVIKDSVKEEMWYSFAVLFPANGFVPEPENEVISQWHQLPDTHLGENAQSPATHLLVEKDRFILGIGYNKALVSDGVNRDNHKDYDLGPVTKDTWHEFVFHFIHSIHAEGLVEVWHNGEKVRTHQGGNMYNNVDMPKWKLGIYKFQWNGEGTTDTHERILYIDNIRVGNARATLADMSPATAPDKEVKPPAAPNGYSFTFVNAQTDADILSFTNSAILSQNVVGTGEITIRAETKIPEIGSMRFTLKGEMKHEFIDNEPPYTMFGDDGSGNYFNSRQLEPGSYTLRVTPFSKADGNGKELPEFTTTFRIQQY
jgi:Polysaccharide lyase